MLKFKSYDMAKERKSVCLSVLFSLFYILGMMCPIPVGAQGEVPVLEEVYGGRVIGISAADMTRSDTRLFVATESANSVFYGDVDHSAENPFGRENFQFQIVPDLDAEAGFGELNGMAAHNSGRLFFGHDYGLFSCDITAESIIPHYTNGPANIGRVLVRDNVLLAIRGNQIMRAALSDAGAVDELLGPFDTGFDHNVFLVMAVSPAGYLYLMDKDMTRDGTPGDLIIKKSSVTYENISATTDYTDISITNIIQDWESLTFGIAPDGRLMVAGGDAGEKKLVYSDDDGETWELVETGIGGGPGELAFLGDTADYAVVCGSAFNTNKGVAGSWSGMPRSGTQDSNPNDGPACADPNHAETFYFTTDLGLGVSTNLAADIFDVDEGLVAVQVNDFDMTDDKYVAWTASKSGVRRATGFPDAPVWSEAMFPNDDGAPYFSVAVDRSDTNGLTAYVGNNKIYKTTDGGSTWTQCLPDGGGDPTFISCIRVAGPMVFAAVYQIRTDIMGGLMISTNHGADFEYYQLADETEGVDINDILLTTEGEQHVTYIAAAYNTNAVTGAGHIYRIVQGGTDEKIDLGDDPVSIRNLAMDDAGGIYASGMFADYAPAMFYKAPDSDTWESLTVTGLPDDVRPRANPNWRGPVMAIGYDSESNNVPIIAADVSLYYLPQGGTKWLTRESLTYPRGTQINVLYWDELMVGTDAGLFAQPTNLDPEPAVPMNFAAGDLNGDGRPELIAVNDQNQLYIWWGHQGYRTLDGPRNIGITGYPALGDFDGDGRADLVIVDNQNRAYIRYSREEWLIQHGPIPLGVAGRPVAGDFDGDGLADLVLIDEQGRAYVWYSMNQWTIRSGPIPLGVQGQPATGDFEGDGLADLVITDNQGRVTIWLSSDSYRPYHQCPLDWGMSGAVIAEDFDGDGLADLVEVRDNDDAYLRSSRANWTTRTGPYPLPMPTD